MASVNFAKILFVRWQQLADRILCAEFLLQGGPCSVLSNEL